jgi:hypothetical protein
VTHIGVEVGEPGLRNLAQESAMPFSSSETAIFLVPENPFHQPAQMLGAVQVHRVAQVDVRLGGAAERWSGCTSRSRRSTGAWRSTTSARRARVDVTKAAWPKSTPLLLRSPVHRQVFRRLAPSFRRSRACHDAGGAPRQRRFALLSLATMAARGHPGLCPPASA